MEHPPHPKWLVIRKYWLYVLMFICTVTITNPAKQCVVCRPPWCLVRSLLNGGRDHCTNLNPLQESSFYIFLAAPSMGISSCFIVSRGCPRGMSLLPIKSSVDSCLVIACRFGYACQYAAFHSAPSTGRQCPILVGTFQSYAGLFCPKSW